MTFIRCDLLSSLHWCYMSVRYEYCIQILLIPRRIMYREILYNYSYTETNRISLSLSLQNIGLWNLRLVQRGGVRIQNNYNLCYVNSVDWSLITPDTSNNVFKVRL